MADYDLSALTKELSFEEGRRKTIYKDQFGHPTVGIGHNLDAGPLPGEKYPLTDARIDQIFAKDIQSSVGKLDANIPWWRNLSPVRQRVLLSMVFQLGWGSLSGFKTFLALVRGGNYATAADDMLTTLWAKQTPARAKRLASMMRTDKSAYTATQIIANHPATAPTAIPVVVAGAAAAQAVESGWPLGYILGVLALGAACALVIFLVMRSRK